MLIDLDKHEMFWLLESAARGSHLRQGLWGKFIDIFFHKMEPSEIRFLREQCIEKLRDFYPDNKAIGYDDFQKFLARFDIDNNFYELKVATDEDSDKQEVVYAFLYNQNYFVAQCRFIDPAYIIKAEKVDTSNTSEKVLKALISIRF